jgi:hypothetical protein
LRSIGYGVLRDARDDCRDPPLGEPVSKVLGIISLVCDQAFGRFDGSDDGLGHGNVSDVSGRQREGNRSAAMIG